MLIVERDLTVGNTASLCVVGSSSAGHVVVVELDNGEGETAIKSVLLDENGNGCRTFTVPNWAVINFRFRSCDPVCRVVEP